MLDILQVVTPVFLVIGAGYTAVWRGLFQDNAVDGLMVFSQRFAIPCLLFTAMSQLDVGNAFNFALIISYFGSTFACFAIAGLGARFLFGRAWEDSVVFGFVGMFANTVLLGLPVTERAYGVSALDGNYSIIAFNAATCYFVGITAMEIVRAGAFDGKLVSTVSKAMFRNEIMLGVALGLSVNFLGLPIPEVVQAGLDLMSRAALPAALFALGGILYRYRPEGDARAIVFLCIVSLVLQPGLAYILVLVQGLETPQIRSAVVTAAMAPGVNTYLFANMYGVAKRVTASVVLLGTALTVVTASLWLIVLP